MLAHRFREFWSQTEPALPTTATAMNLISGFVFCPCPAIPFLSPMQHAQPEYLYRLAYEQARAQVGQSRTSRIPASSLN